MRTRIAEGSFGEGVDTTGSATWFADCRGPGADRATVRARLASPFFALRGGARHTIAIRSVLDRRGRITTWNEGCGGVPATRGEAIPYIDGKRCWINQEIYGVHGAAAWQRQDPRHRTALAAGDADTDVTFVGDATGAHLVLNRNKSELMCRAYDDADGRWVINPMFIGPLPRRPEPYPCATSALNATGGGREPVLRDDGSVVPDQKDTVY